MRIGEDFSPARFRDFPARAAPVLFLQPLCDSRWARLQYDRGLRHSAELLDDGVGGLAEVELEFTHWRFSAGQSRDQSDLEASRHLYKPRPR